MSKQIKQMQMQSLKDTFGEVRDFVMLSISGLDCQADNQLRMGLRKKKISLQMVKNSLARRIFDEAGVKVTAAWEGPTFLAWGANSVAELSREIETFAKKNEKTIKVKGAVAEGQGIPFDVALRMPTREEAIGRIVSLALAPASRLLAQIMAPAATIAGQIKSIGEKKTEDGPVEEPAQASAEVTAEAPAAS